MKSEDETGIGISSDTKLLLPYENRGRRTDFGLLKFHGSSLDNSYTLNQKNIKNV